MIKADIVTDSISPEGIRLITMKLRYPWMIHGELMTHRVFSRNASSNRAVPLAKMLEEVRSDSLRAEPEFWGAEQRGMSPGGELSDEWYPAGHEFNWHRNPKAHARNTWKEAAEAAADKAALLGKIGAHKSLANRLLMPFTHANVIVTSTEWDNFFGLRLHADADPTMRALAVAMWEVKKVSVPKLLQPGQWHLPFVDNLITPIKIGIRVSVSRCARVSYESFETGKRSTVAEDLKLYDRLVGAQPLHASPAEHQATPDERAPYAGGGSPYWRNEEQHGNLRGWRQHRQMLPGQAVAPLPEGYA